MRTTPFLLLTFLVNFASTTTLIPAPLTPTIDSPDAVQSKYKLAWFDNFDSDTLDKNVWRIEKEGKGWTGVYYTKNDNVRVEGGMLHLDCKKEIFKNASGIQVTDYTVGRIGTIRNFNKGYFETRMKVPKAGKSPENQLFHLSFLMLCFCF
jgi:beta-glucanase (GH16 family)